MKKITFKTLPWQLFAFALVFFLQSCENRNPGNADVTANPNALLDNSLERGYILASSLALLAEIDNSTPDQKVLKALHRTNREETVDATSGDTYVLCCCPCYQTLAVDVMSSVQPSDEPRLTRDTALIDAEYTTNRDSTGHCPCPSAMEIIARNVQEMTAALDGKEIAPKKQTGKMEGWTTFKIDEKILTQGKHTLRIQGKFFNNEIRKYELPLLIDEKKPYFLDK
ncbi:MAG: hypothetical protein WEB30_01165 [Cyclobacteriaceae bacterium]